MNIKEYLGQAYRIDQRINSKLEQVASLRLLATAATATLTDMPSSGTRNVHRMEDIIAKIIDLESQINADIDKLVDTKSEVMSVIKRVPKPEHQSLLELRYLCFKSWEDVAQALGYTYRQITRLHGTALEIVDALLKGGDS